MMLAAGPAASEFVARELRRFPESRIRHHFVGQDDAKGVYAKEHHILAGEVLSQHVHTYDHMSILSHGVAHLRIGKGTRVVCGPEVIVIRKGEEHELRAITPVVWFCIHPTEATEPEGAERTIHGGG